MLTFLFAPKPHNCLKLHKYICVTCMLLKTLLPKKAVLRPSELVLPKYIDNRY